MMERPIRMGKMLLVAAAVVASVAVVSGANSETYVKRYVNGEMIPQNVMVPPQGAAMSAANGQQVADDRSLILTKAIVLKKLKKKKNKKKFHFHKSPLKFLPFLGLGGAAVAAASAGSAVGAAAKGVPPIAVPPTLAVLPDNYVWKVHKYNGIDIRPVRYTDVPLPPPSETIVSEVPKAVLVPEPVIEPFPTPDNVVFPEPPKEIPATYGPPAQTYGPPAQTYGPPAQVYGPPAQTYGPPAQTYGPPAQVYGPPAPAYGVPASSYPVPGPTYVSQPQTFNGPAQSFQSPPVEVAPAPVEEPVSNEGLEALSNLGALTDYLPGGENRGLSPLSFFNRFLPGSASSAETPAGPSLFRQRPSAVQNLLGRIPIISTLTSFGSNPTTHLSIPPLPEIGVPAFPEIPEFANLRIPTAPLPNIRLPTKYIIRGEPYVSVYTPPQPAPVVETVQPVPVPEVPAPVPVIETVKPEPSYPLPLEPPQPNPQPQIIVNSYGQPIPAQTGYYVTPVTIPQYGVPVYPAATVPKPASAYGLPGGDTIVAASEIDPATSTDCADAKTCGKSVSKIAVLEGDSRMVYQSQDAGATRPVYKKEPTKTQVVVAAADNMARYLDAEHPAATKTDSVAVVADNVDAQPSTATEEDDES